jgi:hypothetical protein
MVKPLFADEGKVSGITGLRALSCPRQRSRRWDMVRVLGRLLSVLLLGLLVTAPHRATASDDLAQAYMLPELFQIMADEGIASLREEGAGLLSDFELSEWIAYLPRLYDAQAMQANFIAELEARLASQPDIRASALDFARSELGQRVLMLEITARQALLSDEIDTMAREYLSDARAQTARPAIAARLSQVRDRIAANDLVELNVSLGLNTSYAYYMGMLEEDATGGMGESVLLQMVWGQESAIRSDVTDWIESYFLLAYQPLSDSDLQQLIDYSASAEGDAFNRAMFMAFDKVFVQISRDVGRALGRRLNAEPL